MQSPTWLCIRAAVLQVLVVCLATFTCVGQTDSINTVKPKIYKNVIRYNLSGALIARWGGYFVVGYERTVNTRQSFSINVGRTSFPNLTTIETESYLLQRDMKNGGYNISVDYRFYLPKENKYVAPRGIYIGPYFSYNHFKRENEWLYKIDQQSLIKTRTDFVISTVGFQLGYQFIVWKRMAIDLLMVGPGIGFYKFTVDIDTNLDGSKREKLYEAVQELAASKLPGMNYVMSSEKLSANGSFRSTNLGYRYILHIGFLF